MFNIMTSTKFFAPRRQDRKEKYFPISPNLASFAPLRLAPWNILSTEALSFHSRYYFTGRAPWNIDSTKIELFVRSAIPQGELSFIRFPKPKFNGKFQICLDSFSKETHSCS